MGIRQSRESKKVNRIFLFRLACVSKSKKVVRVDETLYSSSPSLWNILANKSITKREIIQMLSISVETVHFILYGLVYTEIIAY